MSNRWFTAVLFLATLPMLAQNERDKVGSVEINVSEAYKAQVKEAVRIVEQPTLEDTTAKKIPVNYDVRPKALSTTFEPDPIKPIVIAGSRMPRLPRNMVRVGIGNFTTPYAEVFLGNDRSKNFNWGVHMRHLSSQTGVKDLAFRRNTWAENEVNAYSKYIMRTSRLTLDVRSSFDRISYYGLRNSHFEDFEVASVDMDLVAQRYNTVAPTLRWESLKLEPTYIKQASLGYRYLWDAFNTQENHIKATSDWVFPVKEEIVDLKFNIDHVATNFADSTSRFQFTHIQFAPEIKSEYKNVFFTFGLNVNINPRRLEIGDSVNEKLYSDFFPNILIDIPLVRNVLAVYGGIDGEMVNQNMHSLSQQNPFIGPVFALNPRRTFRYFAGVKGILAKNLHYNASLYHHSNKDLAIFYRDPSAENFLRPALGMHVFYDDVDITGIKGEITYDNNKGLRIGGHANFRSFRMADLPDAFHLPRAIVGVEGSYLWREKIQGNINFNYVGARTAFNASEFPDNPLNPQLNAFLDVRLGATFHYNDQLSAFVNISNFIASDYELYLGYNVQRFLAMMGITYRL